MPRRRPTRPAFRIEVLEDRAVPAADLVPQITDAPGEYVVGSDLAFSYRVTNDGADAATSAGWNDWLYLSTDDRLDVGDRALLRMEFTNDPNAPLDPAGTYTGGGTLEGSATRGVAPGNYYFLLATDADGAEGESDEDNNVAVAAVTVRAADLVPTAVTITPSSQVTAGDTFFVAWEVANQGDAAPTAFGWTDAVYLSADQTYDPSDTFIDSVSYSNSTPLAPNESYQGNAIVPGSVTDGLAPGTYYLLVWADDTDVQPEGDEDNNVSYAELTLLAPPAADLTATINIAPDQAARGAGFSVSYGVGNASLVAATSNSPWIDAVYLSADEVLDPGDVRIAQQATPAALPLAPGAGYGAILDVLPGTTTQVAPGSYYLLVVADADGGEPEEDEGNNVAAVPFTLLAPDLTTVFAQGNGDLFPGEGYSIAYEVANVGGAAADADYWFDAIYLSADETFDASDTFLAYNYHYNFGSPLQPDESYFTEAYVPGYVTQDGFAAGSYYLLVVADGYGYQTEGDEANNLLAAPVTVLPGEDVDLVVTALTLDTPDWNVGDYATVYYTVQNQGTEPAFGSGFNDGWYDAIYISDDEFFDPYYDTYVTYLSPPTLPLDGGAEYSSSVQFQIPSTAAGDRYVLYVADAYYFSEYYYQSETNGGNNTAAAAIALTGPDLTVTLDTVSTGSAVLGETVELTWTVTNTGNGPANQVWYDSVWLSLDDVPGPGDVYVDAFYQSERAPLGPDTSYSYTATVTLPTGLAPGDYHLFVGTDFFGGDGYNGYQPETSDGNNASATAPITLRGPDLTVALDAAPGSANVGDEVTLSWTVTNAAPDPALGSWSDAIFVSDDPVFDYFSDTYVAAYVTPAQPLDGGGGTYSQTGVTVRIPSTAAGNPRYLLVVTDYTGNHGETDEGNNVAATPLAPLTGPDLTVVIGSVSRSEVVVGQQVEVTYTVTNGGDGPATRDWSDKLYLDGVYVGATDPAGSAGLAAGGSYTATVTVTVPAAAAPGAAAFTVVTDSIYGYNGDQPETNDGNNQSEPAAVTLLAPDLTAAGPAAPLAAIAGGPMLVDWAVTNAGAVSALAGWSDSFYLSTDDVFTPSDDVLVVSVYRSPDDLPAGSAYSTSVLLSLPNPVSYPQFAGGNYYLFVVADTHGNQGETDETNNVSAGVAVALEPNEAPVLDPVGDKEADTGLQLAFTAAASDPNAALDTLVYFLDGAVPGGAGIDPGTGAFTWTPDASLAAQSFTFEVGVRDSLGVEDREVITIRVFGPPSDVELGGGTFAENVPVGTAVGTVTATDPDDDLTAVELVAGAADNARFTLTAGGELRTAAAFDFEAGSSYTIRVRATDARGRTRTEDFAIRVTDLPERADLVVNGGQAQRSTVRGLAVTVDSAAIAAALLDAGRVRLVRRDLSGGGTPAVVGTAGLVSAVGAELRVAWGPLGVGGNRNSAAADGYYTLELDLDGDGTRETTRSFYRLFGDTDGDKTVTAAGDTGDVNGDGLVNATDALLVRRHAGRSLNPDLPLDG